MKKLHNTSAWRKDVECRIAQLATAGCRQVLGRGSRYAIVSAADRRDAMEKLELDRARMDAALMSADGPLLKPLFSARRVSYSK